MKLISLVIVFFLVFFSYTSYAFDSNDFQYWNSESIEAAFTENGKITVKEEFRFGNNASSLYYNFTDFGFCYSSNKYFEMSMNYRHIYAKNDEDWHLKMN